MVLGLASGVLRGQLGRKRGRFPGTLKPTCPDDAQAMTLPCGSVMVTIVLLNVLLMWAAPCGTFFFSRRRVFWPFLADVAGPFLLVASVT